MKIANLSSNERKNLYERVHEAHNNGYKFIIIVDEEHLNKTVKAEAIIEYMNPEYIVRVSATTKTNKEAEFIKIDELEVINAGLITRALYINENVSNESTLSNEHEYLLELAINKRKAIKKLQNRTDKSETSYLCKQEGLNRESARIVVPRGADRH